MLWFHLSEDYYVVLSMLTLSHESAAYVKRHQSQVFIIDIAAKSLKQ